MERISKKMDSLKKETSMKLISPTTGIHNDWVLIIEK